MTILFGIYLNLRDWGSYEHELYNLWGTHAPVSENVEVSELWENGVERTVAKLNPNLHDFPHQEETEELQFWKQRVLTWKLEFERKLRLFIAIHENQKQKISPKLMRKEILGE